MINEHPLILDDSSRDLNPSGLEVEYLYWLRFFPREPIKLFSVLAASAGLAFLINWIFIWATFDTCYTNKGWGNLLGALFAITVMDTVFVFWLNSLRDRLLLFINQVREQFLYGGVNPGVVVCTNPPLVAVATNLGTDGNQHHVIKILTQPLERLKNGVPPVGTRLASIATYQGSRQNASWDDFHPVIIDCVTSNRADINGVFQSISTRDWQVLEVGIDYLRTKKPGLYTLPFLHSKSSYTLTFLPFYWVYKQQSLQLSNAQNAESMAMESEQSCQELLEDRTPQAYFHPNCGTVMKMPEDIIYTYLADPFACKDYPFYCGCGAYILQEQLYWRETGQCLADYFRALQQEYLRIHGEQSQ